MTKLENKIDFVALLAVNNANPNGDPLFDNRPRTDYNGYGEMSQECIKRKIRNRMQDESHPVFVQSADHECADEFTSMAKHAKANLKGLTGAALTKKACETWIDVRAFGQTFAFEGDSSDEKKSQGVSEGIRGPVTVHMARSISPVEIGTMQITRCTNGKETKDGKKDSSTMGRRHFVRFGLYLLKGSVNVQLAEKTGFTYEDAQVVKECLRTLFENDASSARPEGSMEVVKLYWFEHNSKSGQYSTAKVHRSVKVVQRDPMALPMSVEDYDITLEELPGLKPEIIDGL